MKRALVTGGAGFIGSHMCALLVEKGYQVTCLDNFSTGTKANVAGLKGIQVVEGDANDWLVMKQLRETKFHVAFHYAAQVGVQRTEEAPLGVLNDVLGMRHLARLAKEGVIGKIVFASSSEVYGNPQRLPEDEEDGIIGWTPYTAVKLYGEHVFVSLWQEHKIPTVSLRFFNVYGPRQIGTAYGFVVSIFINQALAGKELTIYGDGGQTRDFVHVADNVRMTLAAAESERSFGQVINVGSGQEASILDLAVLVNSVAGIKKEGALKFLPARAREVGRRCASTKKMMELVGVSSDIGLAEGVKKTIAAGQMVDTWKGEPLRMAAVKA